MTYKAASFFSGIGGLDLAFVWAGFEITTHVEIDPYCREVLKKHAPTYWPNAQTYEDIKTVTAAQVGYADVLFGGFPCQDISIAGKRAGLTTETRSGLWFEFLRLIGEIRPRVVVLENVSAIHVPTRNEYGNEEPSPALIVAASLAEVGYDAIWIPLRASDIGAPHQRERWFCMAYSQDDDGKRDSGAMERTPRTTRKQANGRIIVGSRARDRAALGYTECEGLEGEKWGWASAELAITNRGLRRESRASLKSRLGRNADGFSVRLDRHQWPAGRGSQQFDYEAPRVTGRKDNRVSRVKALGNAVVPQQGYPIALAVRMFLDEVQE